MSSVQQLLDAMCRIAPPALKQEWDNVGLLVGRRDREVTRVVLALDVTGAAIEEAARRGAQLLITHHPMLPAEMAGRITDETTAGRKVLALIEHRLAAICMHTNLDAADDGVNVALGQALGFEESAWLGEDRLSRWCALEKTVDFDEFVRGVRAAIDCRGLRYFPAGRPVKKVAWASGSGGAAFPEVVKAGCDTFVTGDVRYSLVLDAAESGVNLVDAGHYTTEVIVLGRVMGRLKEKFPEIEFTLYEDDPTYFLTE